VPLRFPDGFLWGSATASHQVEGGNTESDWAAWEQQPDRIVGGAKAGAAAMWWAGRAEEDLSRAAELGHNAHRMSLEWSRLEPSPGVYDLTAFERYREILAHARKLGLATSVTVDHFTLPKWAAASRSWHDPALIERFATFAAQSVRQLGDVVDMWATINEPNVLALLGYAYGRWPPGERGNRSFLRALANLLRAHALGYRAMKAERADASIGLVLSMPYFAPFRPTRTDRAATRGQDWIFNGALLSTLQHGRLPPPLSLTGTPIEHMVGAYDWIGLNYYGCYKVKFDATKPHRAFGIHVDDGNIKTATSDWGAPHPAGLVAQLERLSVLGVPLFVTENGIFDNEDRLRPRYLVDHVRAVYDAIAKGVDVRGYFHWSLIDNFEWAEGWSTRFGLIGLDVATQQRTVKRSAQLYARICASNGIPDDLPEAS